MNAAEFAHFVKGLGFRVFVAMEGKGSYGFIADDTGSRVLSFGFSDGGNLGGNYGPPSREGGTGWRLEQSPHDLRTRQDVWKALHAYPPEWCRGWKRLTTVEQYLSMYGSSSKFREV